MLYYRKYKIKSGFSLLDVLLAIGILGCALFVLFAFMAPTLKKSTDILREEEIINATSKINALIKTQGFEEIFLATQQEKNFYFYNGPEFSVTSNKKNLKEEIQKMSIEGSIIKIKLEPASLLDIKDVALDKFDKAVFPIQIKVYVLSLHCLENKNLKPTLEYIIAKNR